MKNGDYVYVYRTPRQLPHSINLVKKSGKVICISEDRVGVEFEFEFVDGHDCNGNGKYGRCWYIEKNCLQVMEQLIKFNVLNLS